MKSGDTEIQQLIREEEKRAAKVVNLIASENLPSKEVRRALSSLFVVKYAEGYPGKRYYGGNSVVDKVELLAQKRALTLFGLSFKKWAVNVQAHSGSPANLAIYKAIVPLGGKIMGLSLSHGGHLTHGSKVSSSGTFWTSVSYTLNPETELLDYEKIREIALREKPAVIVAGFTAYSRKIDWKKFRTIADECGALLHVDASHIAGLIAGGVFPSPFPYADTVMMTTHKTLRGPRGALIFSRVDARGISEKVDKAVFPGLQGGPHMHTIAAIAVSLREASQTSFKAYARTVVDNARTLAQELSKYGLRIVSGGTDSHLFLVDTFENGKGLSGTDASDRLEKEGIIVNKNTIPNETRSPRDPSGIRIGTAFETTRGWKPTDMKKLAHRIAKILDYIH